MSSLTLIRHATVHVHIGGVTFLVDPMLGDKHAYSAVEGTQNPVPWPLVDLPVPAADVVDQADAVVLTHTHVDHFDERATELVARSGLPVFCQPEDTAELERRGIGVVRAVTSVERWRGVTLTRTGGEHGNGEMAQLMGPVSGWVFSDGADSVYVAGDTVFCGPVREVIETMQPGTVVVNSGAARMETGDPITMDAADVIETAQVTRGVVVAVHLETLNHCGLTRADLARATQAADAAVRIPADGQTLELPVNAR